MRVQKIKGARDLSPEQMTAFRFIERVFRESCLKWGYLEVRTPTIESLHLFTSAGTLTPDTLGKVYSFLDWDGWSGERVVLRPDGTIPIARLYIEGMGERLARFFYLSNIFVFEGSGKESRERWQCGAELIGAGSRTADAELVALSLEILRKLNIGEVELRLSHAGFIEALLAGLKISHEEQARAFDHIMDGKTDLLPGLAAALPEVRETLLPLLSLQGQSSGYLKNLKALISGSFPEVIPQLDDFIALADLIERLGYTCRIDIPSGGGFEYYTGAMFQLYAGQEKVGGGGRYDRLIPSMGGGDVPASGFALYLDRLMNLARANGKPAPTRVLVRSENAKSAFEAAQRLREIGCVAELDLGEKARGYTWTLQVQDEPPCFTLTSGNSRIEAATIAEILKVLGDAD